MPKLKKYALKRIVLCQTFLKCILENIFQKIPPFLSIFLHPLYLKLIFFKNTDIVKTRFYDINFRSPSMKIKFSCLLDNLVGSTMLNEQLLFMYKECK